MAVPIERLAAHHVRVGFDCGDAALNDFLLRQAGQLQRRGFGKTYVALADDGATATGFVTVSAGQVATAQLPASLKLPRYPVPVVRVGRLAVDARHQGHGIGQDLLAFALQLALEFSQQVGLYAVLVDAKDEKAKAFYTRLGFVETADDSLCLFLPIGTLAKARQP
ncbi:MAG: GNAT family N-acetyltransferase [Rhodoferax sp.]|nr:GNAT family N-acetyltransferase [Rhodoferax sp.]